MKTPQTKEEATEIAKEIIEAVDNRGLDDPEVKVPSWLKLSKGLHWYFDWKSVKWEKGIGWYPDFERIVL